MARPTLACVGMVVTMMTTACFSDPAVLLATGSTGEASTTSPISAQSESSGDTTTGAHEGSESHGDTTSSSEGPEGPEGEETTTGDEDTAAVGSETTAAPEEDCNGVPNGDAVLDACGVCDGDDSSCADCDGVPNGDAVEDVCGVCNGDGSSCADCDGVPNGDAVEDPCGVCNGDGSSCADCDGVPNGGAVLDACGVCGGDDSSCADCDGVPNGDAVEDVCGVCNGDGTSCLDCAGEPNGDAVLDACGVCNGLGKPCWGCTTPSASNFNPLATVNDGTCVCEPVNGGISDQVNVQSNAGSGSTDQWQSFTVGLSGGLTQVDLGVGSPINGDSPGQLRFYAGEGIAGIELGSQDVVFEDLFNTMQAFELDNPIPMTAGEVYTVRFTVPNVTVGWVDIANFDAYDGGRGSFSPNIDFVFRTYVSQCIPE